MARNTLYVAQGHDHAALLSKHIEADSASWIAGSAPPSGRFGAKTRYRQADASARLTLGEDTFQLCFETPQWAATPGQSAVLYDGDVCLGGGLIAQTSALQQSARLPTLAG
jgi:tRNA-specific 2-thiouridylase